MHQKFHKSEIARKFYRKSFRGSKNPSLLKLYAGCSGPYHVHTWDAEGQGMYIHVLNKERSHIHGKDMKSLSKCWCQVPEV